MGTSGRPGRHVDWRLLDEAYRDLLSQNPDRPLLLQTLLTAGSRRRLIELAGASPGERVLDVGTGFGPLAFELAASERLSVIGLDRDPAVLAETGRLAGRLETFLRPGSEVAFTAGAVEEIPFGRGSFDLATARLLFQHLPDPSAAAAALGRVLRPGGRVLVFDVDDGISAGYPSDDGPAGELEAAYGSWQARYGDRRIGRKLCALLAGVGMRIEQVELFPQAAYAASHPGDATRTVTAARWRAARDGIVASGRLSADRFDALLQAYESAPPSAAFRAECQVAVVARLLR